MNNKDLFITAVQSMVDCETIFMASAEFWGVTYDRIEAGDKSVDATFTTIYKTINTISLIQNNPMLIRAEEDRNNRRMLLDALSQRINGYSVIVMSITSAESRYMQKQFFEMVDDLFADTSLNQQQLEDFNRGQLEFKVSTDSVIRDVCLTHDGVGLLGFMRNHKLFLTQETIKQRFIKKNDPFVSLLNKYSAEKELDRFITKAEVTLKNKAEQRYKQLQMSLEIARAPLDGWVIQGV